VSTLVASKKWCVSEPDWPAANALAEAVKVPPLVAHLLLLRGIDTPEAARDFLRPSLKLLSDPFALTGMKAAVERIQQAKDAQERVLIFGDYDVDGVTASAILIQGLRRYGIEDVQYSMPLRLTEGYGLSPEHVDTAKADGIQLIITVDNGISAHAAALRASELGIDLIITDHHAIEHGFPEAVAVVNPKREGEEHPAFNLCGAGVAFKLSTALNGTANDLDIAAMGTVADIVPLLGENRSIVALGLRHMAKYQRIGLAKLAKLAGFQLLEVSSEKIGFQLGPRINAAGRLDNGLTALHLLLSECPQEAAAMAEALNTANEERRAIETAISEEALAELESCFTPEQRGIVVFREGWHAGVIGIVASRIQTRYHRPTIVIAIDEDGTGRASARSGRGFNLVEAISACSEHLVRFGGHRAAAGFTIEAERIPEFVIAFEKAALEQLGDGPIVPEIPIDGVAAFSQIDGALLKALEALEPMGHRNPAPVFSSLSVEVVPHSVQVLKERHLKFLVRQGGTVFPVIGFGMAERFYTEEFGGAIDIAYTPQFNTWRGNTTIQLLLKDIRPATTEEAKP
jgi:single-stranded-DNA-specific exonuclease